MSASSVAPIIFSSQGIAWPSDAIKFKKNTRLASLPNLNAVVYPPPQWVKAFPDPSYDFSKGYTAANFPDISTMERFQVWMRPAGLPNFRKIWGKTSGDVLAGTYKLAITQSKYMLITRYSS